MAEMDRMIKALPVAALQVPPLAYDFAVIKAGIGERKK